MKTVKEVMAAHPVSVTLLDNIYEVAVAMRDSGTGFIPVVDSADGAQLIGVITDRDLVIRGYAAKHPGSTAVETVMSREVLSVQESASVEEAADLMASAQIRRLPVTQGKKLTGVVSLGDLAVKRMFADEAAEAIHEISQRQQLH